MNEQPYKSEHLQEYWGILTSDDARGERFKMELKAEDNPVMERWTQKDKSAIELEFRYNGGPSTMFFHNRRTCENYLQGVDCNECERIQNMYNIFASNLSRLQFGDTFRINAALINNKERVLPAEIHNFESYQPLLVACDGYSLRLPDTPEGINKKYVREQQRLQQEEDKKANDEQAEKDARRRKRKESIQHFLGKRPNLNQIIVVVIATTIANQILPRIFIKIYHLLFPN